MFSNEEIRSLYSKFGNKDYPVETHCIGCLNCNTYSFPCLNCARYVFDNKLGCGNPNEMGPDIETPLDMFLHIHYDEEEIKFLIPKENKCPDAPIKVYPKPRTLNTNQRKLKF